MISMVIRTLETIYTVAWQIPYGEDNNVYICGEEGSNDLTLLVEITDKDTIRDSVEYLMSQKRAPEFSDFKDCFFSGENLYAAFTYANSRAFGEILKEDAPLLPERLAMMRELFEKWMLLKLPPYFAYDTATSDRVRFTVGNKSVLAFGLSDITAHDGVTFVKVQKRLAALWDEVFAGELAKESVPELARFRQSLSDGIYEDIPALFVAYDAMQEAVLHQPEGDWTTPKTWPFRLWDRIKKVFPAVKLILEIFLVVAAFFILMASIRLSMSSGGQQRQFDRIGTLEIREEPEREEGEDKGNQPWHHLQDLLSE